MNPMSYVAAGIVIGLGIWIITASLRSMYKDMKKL